MRTLPALMLAGLLGASTAASAATIVPSQEPWPGLPALQGKRSYVDTPLGQVHLTSLGDGPAVVLLHQTPWFSVQYAKAQPLIAKAGFRAIAVDTPGYGLSTLPDHPPTVAEYADALVAVLDRLGLRRAAFLGHHTGSTLAATAAARHPDRVVCVAMHGVPLYTAAERAERLKTQLHADTALKPDGSHMTARWKTVADRIGEGNASEASVQWAGVAFLLAGSTEWYGHQAVFAYDLAPALRAIKAPTLVMSNTADTLHAADLRTVAMRPDFAYREFLGGNAHMMYDDAAQWAAPVIAFLKERCRP
jgi:pimeloyl-ACP methyl ester carboxylesterase